MPSAGRCLSQATAVYSWVLGVRTMQVDALLGDLGPAKRPQITAPFLHLYDNRFALSARVSAERATGFLKSRRMCSPPHTKEEKERGAAGGSPQRHALSLLLLPPQAASLS